MFCSSVYKKGQKGKKEVSEQKRKDKEKKTSEDKSREEEEEEDEEEERMEEEPEAAEEDVENWALMVVHHSDVTGSHQHQPSPTGAELPRFPNFLK